MCVECETGTAAAVMGTHDWVGLVQVGEPLSNLTSPLHRVVITVDRMHHTAL